MEQDIYEQDIADKTPDQWRQYTKELRRKYNKCRQQAGRSVKRASYQIAEVETALRRVNDELADLKKKHGLLMQNYETVVRQLNAVPKSMR